MMGGGYVKLVVFAPVSHADAVRSALGAANAGVIGNYTDCSFSSRGTGRYRGNAKSAPAIGRPETYEAVEEERIEVRVERSNLRLAVEAMKAVHPYDEVAFDIYALEDFAN